MKQTVKAIIALNLAALLLLSCACGIKKNGTEKLTAEPTEAVIQLPTDEPKAEPTEAPTSVLTEGPTAAPTEEPTASPTPVPTATPTPVPTATPTPVPTATPTPEPTATQTPEPTATPTPKPTATPTPKPTATPTPKPTATPTPKPTATPTPKPTATPTPKPTATPTPKPTATPTIAPTPDANGYVNTAEYRQSYSVGIDDLGRTLRPGSADNTERTDRQVGIFYFLWIGYHGTALYDNSAIVARDPNALKSESAWMNAGGGGVSAFHFWGKPMYGYYPSSEKWVMRKHVQMLTDAGVDFLCFDATNAFTYTNNALALMSILKEYQDQGWDVPKVCFYTNSSSGQTINAIYREIYKAKPEYQSIWYYWDGKPMIVGNPNDSVLSAEAKSFFRIKRSVWPNDVRYADGFPWMEFGRLMTSQAVYGLNGRKEVVNVSVAQHNATCTFSFTAWYGANDRTRSWHNGRNDKSENAYLYGYNFDEQFRWAIAQDPEMIFITGWNEWIAQRQPVVDNNRPIRFVDNADPNCSRDIEPMEGGYGDNYYMQMISLIRQYKGAAGSTGCDVRSVDIDGSFGQWNDVSAYYRDYAGDAIKRNNTVFERKVDTTNRNDFVETKVCEDADNIYFFVKTAAAITAPEANDFDKTGWMTLYISTDLTTGWKGYDYVINYRAPSEGETSVGRLADPETYTVTDCGSARIRIADDLMMLSVPKTVLGISGSADFAFKWADNNTLGDVFSFYKNGDAAPIGRAMYRYGD
ncbi:MAG: hypothetical protein IJM24_05245 [Clostridia bacterium]|nr:hypothetical protein [Clostridia bacterium]